MSTIWSFHWIAGLAVWRFANTTRIGFAAATFHILLIFWIIQLNTNFWIEIGSIGNSCFNFFPEILILHIPKLCSFARCFQNCFCFLSMTFPSHVVTFGQQILVLHWNYSGDIKAKFDLGITFYQARALRALGLLLAGGTPTVGGGKTFWAVSQFFLRKQL